MRISDEALASGIEAQDELERALLANPEVKQAYDDARVRRLAWHNLLQEHVAEKMGVPVKAVKEFECYRVDPRLSFLQRYARVVGVRVSADVESS